MVVSSLPPLLYNDRLEKRGWLWIIPPTSLPMMGLLAGLLLSVCVGTAPNLGDEAGGDPGVVAVAPADAPDSGSRLVADPFFCWPSVLAWMEEAEDDDEGPGECDGLLALPPAGTPGPAGSRARGGTLNAARLARCPLFLLLVRLVC